MPEPADASATGREMAVEGRNGGTLTRHPKGSNGGVHRGPDLGLRRHLIRGVLLEAMARKGETVKSLREKNATRKRKLMPHAMTETPPGFSALLALEITTSRRRAPADRS